jgi:adenylate cyclase
VSTAPVALESILPCLQGVIPSPLATCAADGTPNITYMSIVQYIDSERVGLSRQFFRKTGANLEQNPHAQVLVVDPATIEQFTLDLRYLHTETTGPAFDAMQTNLEAIASQSGVGGSVFRLRGIDIYHVERCAPVRPDVEVRRGVDGGRDVLKALDELVERMSVAEHYEEATEIALQALEDLFGFPYSMLLVAAGGDGGRIFGVAANGYPGSPAGAEVVLGEGAIGVAAQRRRLVCLTNVARGRVMGSAVAARAGRVPVAHEIPLPGLENVQSAAAVPLLVHGQLTGVLYLESDELGTFGAHNERLLRVIGGHLAAVLAALERDRDDGPTPAAGAAATMATASGPPQPGGALELVYYQADDSVFAGGEYVIKGVPGRILWKLLREHESDGRTAFTNRELRLDERLGLPAGNDNLEARLVALRRRLETRDFGLGLHRVARGRMLLQAPGPLTLVEVPTRGPMQAAHSAPDQVA